jgi:hypothetical protein
LGWFFSFYRKGVDGMAKEHNKKINTEEIMWEMWKNYKKECDNKTVIRTEFSQRTSEFVSAVIPAPVTYTIKGFCKFIGMTEANFYATYNKKSNLSRLLHA